MRKIIEDDSFFFKDDVQIKESELEKKLNLPTPPLFMRDELQVIYKGHIFLIAKDKKDNMPDAMIKIYKKTYGLQAPKNPDGTIQTIKSIEDKYFQDNADLINKFTYDMISKGVTGIPINDKKSDDDDDSVCFVTTQIASQLVEKINNKYSSIKRNLPKNNAGTGSIIENKDGSEFNNHFNGSIGLLILDRKVYHLETIQEYVKKFEKSFEPTFFKKFYAACSNTKPEDICAILNSNADKIHKKAMPLVRNKIWFSNRSFKLYLDGTYFVPSYAGTPDDIEKEYFQLIERKAKIDGVKKYL